MLAMPKEENKKDRRPLKAGRGFCCKGTQIADHEIIRHRPQPIPQAKPGDFLFYDRALLAGARE
jgi:hypothetical protein